MPDYSRRNFLRNSGLAFMPAVLPNMPKFRKGLFHESPPEGPMTKFFLDGEMFTPSEYLNLLQEFNQKSPFAKDQYGEGGAVAALEKRFEEITGKEKAMFMPSGTLANQLAISVLSDADTKVFVQETSHVFRDEADAAQSVFQKRLIPIARGKTCFTAAELEEEVKYHLEGEVFKSGIGVISIENPVRRSDGRMVPIEEIRKIRDYCRSQDFRMHLDGARIFMASGWSGVPIRDYAECFDTVYISLYKYFGAAAGAVLCGSKDVMAKMGHLVKVHGGNMFGNWLNAAMALNRLEGFEQRLQQSISRSARLFVAVNQIKGMQVSSLEHGTNMYRLKISGGLKGNILGETLRDKFNIRIPRPNADGECLITVNETLLYRDEEFLTQAFHEAAAAASK